MSKPRSHLLDIYSAWIHVATDRKGWRKLRREVTSLAKDPGGMGFTSCDVHETDSGAPVRHMSVYIDVKAHDGNQVALVETVAHEAAHVAGMLFGQYEAEIRPSDEPHAYLVGWVAQWLWQAVQGA